MKTVLAIDTSGATCSAALWVGGVAPYDPEADEIGPAGNGGENGDGGIVLGSIRLPMARGHAEALLPLIETLLQRTGRRPGEIDIIGVVHGPGAFTGLRIGLAAAAGLSLATGAPVVGVNAFDAFAEGALVGLNTVPTAFVPNHDSVCTVVVAIDSRRREMYLRTYRANRDKPEQGKHDWSLEPGPEMVCIPPADATFFPALQSVWVTGSGARRFCDENPAFSADSRHPPEAIDAGIVARLAWRTRSHASLALPDPLYLRPPDAVAAAPPRGIIDRISDAHAASATEQRHDPPTA